MFRSRSWFGGGLWKPKNVHSLEHLKYLYNVLSRNQSVNESNKGLLVESLRSISEILIWGDQNDSSVFDFFLEKNMLSFFLKIMKQKCGSYVCVQLLQTLNILFENIRNETSLYYLLSNNHVNSIIVHKFDFSDEEVMAYYISFLKTLSLKLNSHTIHFFYNEHTNDFPLYTEAIKFFNHSESMVRIAVRTLTLNVYRVDDRSMLEFIRDRTAAPYFSNLVWFIGKHVLELDGCLRNDTDHNFQNRLADLVAEHLDHLHYINDILCLEISDLNEVLSQHLLEKLFTPLYIRSLPVIQNCRSQISRVSALFLLSQVFLIINQKHLVNLLAELLLRSKSDDDTFLKTPPPGPTPPFLEREDNEDDDEEDLNPPVALMNANITDEEKSKILGLDTVSHSDEDGESLNNQTPYRPCAMSIINALDCTSNDYSAILALCLLYAVMNNSGVSRELLDELTVAEEDESHFHTILIEKLVRILCQSCQSESRIRLVTLQLTIKLLQQLSSVSSQEGEDKGLKLSDAHVAAIAGGKEESTSLLRELYKSEEMFLDIFVDEHNELTSKSLNVEFLMMDAAMLLPPTATPMTGIEFSRRLPCGEVERARKSIRVFFLIRNLCILLGIEQDTPLPLNNLKNCVQIGDVLDLNNSDLIACTVVQKDGSKIRRFLVMDLIQLILVEPDTNRLGWGVAKLVGFLQDLEVTGDKDDSRCLHITIHRSPSGNIATRTPILAARFIFDDHIRCMAAKQRLSKGRTKARHKKMHAIAKLLDLPLNLAPASPIYQPQKYLSSRDLRPLFSQVTQSKAPSCITTVRRSSESPDRKGGGVLASTGARSRDSQQTKDSNLRRARKSDGSPRGGPRMPRPRSEEIPLGDMRSKHRRENILLSNATQLPGLKQQGAESASTKPLASTSGIIVLSSESPNFIQPVVIREETRFVEEKTTEVDGTRRKRKGKIETV